MGSTIVGRRRWRSSSGGAALISRAATISTAIRCGGDFNFFHTSRTDSLRIHDPGDVAIVALAARPRIPRQLIVTAWMRQARRCASARDRRRGSERCPGASRCRSAHRRHVAAVLASSLLDELSFARRDIRRGSATTVDRRTDSPRTRRRGADHVRTSRPPIGGSDRYAAAGRCSPRVYRRTRAAGLHATSLLSRALCHGCVARDRSAAGGRTRTAFTSALFTSALRCSRCGWPARSGTCRGRSGTGRRACCGPGRARSAGRSRRRSRGVPRRPPSPT